MCQTLLDLKHVTTIEIIFFLGVAFLAKEAGAPCLDPPDETQLTSYGSEHSVVATDAQLGKTVVVADSTLYILDTSSLAIEMSVPLGGFATNAPAIARLDDNSWAIFVSASNRVIYRINPFPGVIVWQQSLARCPSDSLSATPTVHLRRLATNAFKAIYTTDVVYVGTNYSSICGSSISNRVYALRVTDGRVLRVFNQNVAYSMDAISQGQSLDIARDRLYVGSDRTGSVSQHTLWAINVLNMNLVWSKNAGPIEASPQVLARRVYVATKDGFIKAYTKSNGKQLWKINVGPTSLKYMFVQSRDPYGHLVGAVGRDGRIRLVRDAGEFAELLWNVGLPNDARPTTRFGFDSGEGELYVGADDGQAYQLAIDSGTAIVSPYPNSATSATVKDLTHVMEDTDDDGFADDPRLITTTSNRVIKHCAPF